MLVVQENYNVFFKDKKHFFNGDFKHTFFFLKHFFLVLNEVLKTLYLSKCSRCTISIPHVLSNHWHKIFKVNLKKLIGQTLNLEWEYGP